MKYSDKNRISFVNCEANDLPEYKKMEAEITFILPTRNRKTWVVRAIDSCLSCESEAIKPRIIVIDGESEDGTYDHLRATYGSDPRVIIQKNKYSFMDTCFYGVGLVKTKFATFMYDDDVLSLHFGDMIAHMLKHEKDFIMGYGRVCSIEQVYPFKPVSDFDHYPNLQLLLGYYGYRNHIKYTFLPVSPICCVLKADLLREWRNHVLGFAKKYKIREHFMLEKNVGPDLMIYLLSIITNNKDICVASATVAQFSSHLTSMTVTYETHENTDLAIGYWLARIWAFEYLLEMNNRIESVKCASYLILSGIKILMHKIIAGRIKWSLSIIREVLSVCLKVMSNLTCTNALMQTILLLRENAGKRPNETFPE